MITKRFLLFISVFILAGTANAYDFSAVSNGQTLYYKILNASNVKVTHPASVTAQGSWGTYSKPAGDIVIPSTVFHNGINYTVSQIDSFAFNYCEDITSCIIPNTVTRIYLQAFSMCRNMESVAIGNNVSFIGGAAFEYTGIHNVVIPNGINEILTSTFEGCPDLETVVLPNGIISIGNYAFLLCHKLKSINLPNSLTTIGLDAFALCYSLAALEIPSTVTTIRNYAFQMLPNIYYNGNATGSPWGALCIGAYYEDSVYYFNSAKTQVVSVIRDATSIYLPVSVERIRKSAFYGCSILQSLTIDALTPPTVEPDNSFSSYAFEHVPTDIDLVVPCESVSEYISNSDWNVFTNIHGEFEYDVFLQANDPSRGYVDILSSATCENPHMIVEAVPYSGYRFAFWSDNNTDPLRNIEVTDDVHLTAYFTPLTAIDEAETDRATVTTGIGYIRVSCDNPEHIIISDITGRILYSGNSANVTLSVPHGVYMVRVGDKQNKKIIVY